MAYKLLKQGVRRIVDGASIPQNPENTDWQQYQKWLAASNTPQPADLPTAGELNAPILAQLAAADIRAIRALADGDSARIAAHRTAQALLRAKLV